MTEKNINELWRSLFAGENHKVISNHLARSFNIILRLAEEHNLIKQSDYVRARIAQANIDDISDASKLIALRFEASFKNRAGFDFQSTLPTLMQTFCYSTDAPFLPAEKMRELKSLVYKGLQLEVICKQLNYSRNLNAHSHDNLDDLGHGVIVSGAVLRLCELFEFTDQDVLMKGIHKICYAILQRCEPLAPSSTINEIDLPEGHFDHIDEIDEETSLLNGDGENQQSQSLPVEYLPDSENQELKRQKLMALRPKILVYMRERFASLKRDKCILSHQIITELLALKITGLEDLSRSPSISYLLDTNEDPVRAQLGEFGEAIIDILDQSDE